MEAIILAGGLGARLRSVLPPDLPKSMAPVGDRPFLAYLLDNLLVQGFTHVILSVFFGHQIIQTYFGDRYKNIEIDYAIEDEALGTGGGMKHAMSYVHSPTVFAFNGDSLLLANYQKMFHQHGDAELSVALYCVEHPGRYGSVQVENGLITHFSEKIDSSVPGYINAGVYLLNKQAFLQRTERLDVFSFEKDFLEKKVRDIKPKTYITNEYFIDIGVPEDYRRFCLATTTDIIP